MVASSFLLWALDNAGVMQQRGCEDDDEAEDDEA
jgi:hypothetical protein